MQSVFHRCLIRASLTVEAAVVLPVFIACMSLMMQLCNVYQGAARYSSALSQSAQEMAIGAYALTFGQPDPLISYGVGTAYGSARTLALSGDNPAVRSVNFLLSDFPGENDEIDLTMTYQIRSPSGLVNAPWIFFLQKGAVRGWTGRVGSGASDHSSGEDAHGETVYVAENGTVYHKDPHCTHIHLSIEQTDRQAVPSLRNEHGEKYHACELCGGAESGTVYITSDGNRYHSSLNCSGLKRTIHEETMDEAGHLRPCSRCAK